MTDTRCGVGGRRIAQVAAVIIGGAVHGVGLERQAKRSYRVDAILGRRAVETGGAEGERDRGG